MRKWTPVTVSATVMALAVLVALPAAAGESPAVTKAGDRIEWSTGLGAISAHHGVQLSVSTDGYDFEYQFAAGVRPSLALFDHKGQPLADGTYTWELRSVAPHLGSDVADRANGREGRRKVAKGKGAAVVRNGSFTISGGALIDSTLVEPGTEHEHHEAEGNGGR